MNGDTAIPRFVSVVAIALGGLDLARGFVHTILLDYAATHIAGLDHALGAVCITRDAAAYAPSQAAWGGPGPLLVYPAVSALTFVAGLGMTLSRRKRARSRA